MHHCPLHSDPAACFAKYQELFLSKRNRHSWESIGQCQGCKFARINAELAHVPEAEQGPHRREDAPPSADDFKEPPPRVETRGRKARKTCLRGHNEWGWQKQKRGEAKSRYCRACNRARVNRQRNGEVKEVAA